MLRPMKVCGDGCVVISFNKEVRKVKGMLAAYATEARDLARSVVECSGPTRSGGTVPNRSGTRLAELVDRVSTLDTNCKVCQGID